ncbi:Rne/Rng family ribonuclease [Pseudemcibacter aquimaris]|uniref:Rne/Rng family ribonuclease n=1 Tax=Pseudemcibacter aquimaris TaxID=2857064 RepID=UPI002012AA52|nr:Rne/Rng family ribonuclease [Pseudemcibacter aquimaris]MCC3860903.1 Rne/Rng family ribonuclease [Pseudemcibacter aquimaris]WDU59722.1 Rne/Rng family ribonuclease [Pseudemcibacter aquimaris]
MSIRMLIDASHREETRVAIVDGNRVEDFDYESSAKKQLKGSIYLAKVTRVEPSLQAAFVDYGGNRHGFLAFSEIHPDYYQIPVADREALIEEEKARNADLLEDEENNKAAVKSEKDEPSDENDEVIAEENTEAEEKTVDESSSEEAAVPEETSDDVKADETAEATEEVQEEEEKPKRRRGRPRKKKTETKAESTKEDVITSSEEEAKEDASEADDANEDVSDVEAEKTSDEENSSDDVAAEVTEEAEENKPDEDASDEATDEEETNNAQSEEDEEERLRIRMAKRLRYKYKIQEVIKKGQIILIQVVKEERGNKGAALTTYLSLPGRYCVLMPNTLHGGGVSRKIANVKDRKKLKNVLSSLNLPKGHACIIRTAGSDRTKAEIKRDYDYLKRMWEAIREHTLKSIAPTLIYEEGNLIKRSIRDLYTRDISEILVEGERGYKTAKSFMQMLMPSHARKIKYYSDQIPLFQRYQVENHLDSMYGPTAQLKSGGYIVINPTEALVSIDVNSGRATKEHNIEETALNTNLEAAEEIARQLKLRDMSGLVVIDFIDMEEQRNNRAVERKMKACLKSDRARIQVGRISSFGLMEMSRQRLRTGVLESSTIQCPHCDGSGLLRTVESQSLHILRIIEEEGIRARNSKFKVFLPSRVAIYLLNNKRRSLRDLEERYDFSVEIAIDDELTASAYRMDRSGKPSRKSKKRHDALKLGKDVNKLIDVTEEDVSADDEKQDKPKRRRRRRRNRNNKRRENQENQSENTEENEVSAEETDAENQENSEKGRRRRRPRRGRGRDKDNAEKSTEEVTEQDASPSEVKTEDAKTDEVKSDEEKPKRKPRRTRKKADTDKSEEANAEKSDDVKEEKPKRARRTRKKKEDAETSEKPEEGKTEEKAEKPKRAPRKRAVKKTEEKEEKPASENKKETEAPKAEKPKEEKPADDKPKKKGWWSRALS